MCIMAGFFEDLPSERGIAARCADSIAIRRLPNYELDENTLEHSSLKQFEEVEILPRGFHAVPARLAGAWVASGQASEDRFIGDGGQRVVAGVRELCIGSSSVAKLFRGASKGALKLLVKVALIRKPDLVRDFDDCQGRLV